MSEVPGLAYDPANEITAEDIPTPRVKFAQGLSKVVSRGLVPYGNIYATLGADDPDPAILAAQPKGESTSPPVRFYVLAGPKKGYSYTNKYGDLDNTRDGSYPDLSLVRNDDPREVYRTFDYVIALPDHCEQGLPFKLMLYKKWGGSAAKRINLELLFAKNAGKDASSVAFTLSSRKDEGEKGDFCTAVVDVAQVPALEAAKDQEVVEKLKPTAVQLAGPARPQIAAPATTTAPALD